MEETIKSPSGQQEIFLLPFSAEAVEELFSHDNKTRYSTSIHKKQQIHN